jgi:hypothetical protein
VLSYGDRIEQQGKRGSTQGEAINEIEPILHSEQLVGVQDGMNGDKY